MTDPKITPREGHNTTREQWLHCEQEKFVVLNEERGGEIWVTVVCLFCREGVTFLAADAEAVKLPQEVPN